MSMALNLPGRVWVRIEGFGEFEVHGGESRLHITENTEDPLLEIPPEWQIYAPEYSVTVTGRIYPPLAGAHVA